MITVNPFQGSLNQRICDAADFDGTNDYMTRGAGLTGAADSKSGIFSCWVRLDGGDGTTMKVFDATSGGIVYLERLSTNVFRFAMQTSASVSVLIMSSSSTYLAAATWLHLLASWDAAAAGSHLYVNNVSNKSLLFLADATIDYTKPDWSVGAAIGATEKLNGCLSEFYFAPGQYLDFSVEANRRKFISSSGKPQHLGTDGSLPTGTAPAIYLHLDDGEAVANFATNRGTGGNFSITGTLDTASTSPSD